ALSDAEFAGILNHSKVCRVDRPTDTIELKVAIILDYVAESIVQCMWMGTAGMLEAPRDEQREMGEALGRMMGFYSGVIGVLSNVMGYGIRPSTYGHFNTPNGNQIDLYLKALGLPDRKVKQSQEPDYQI
ncbi:MAG: hypothetical protein WCT36_02925, partial [Candidatus Gracilibacteria bacterium]